MTEDPGVGHPPGEPPGPPPPPRGSVVYFIGGIVLGALLAAVPSMVIALYTSSISRMSAPRFVVTLVELLMVGGLIVVARRVTRRAFLKGMVVGAAFVCLLCAACWAVVGFRL